MKKQLFITFEGTEGCGKSTQVQLLKVALEQKGHETLVTREPGGPPVSEAIRKILLDPSYLEMLPETELLLYMASRSQHTGQWIAPALQAGKIVICDRYNDSTIAYQGAARDLDQSFIASLASFATFGLRPDITFLIDLPVQIGMSRIKQRALDRLELESVAFHQKVRDQYLEIAKKEHLRYVVINGTQSVEEIHQEILQAVLGRMP
ncbi:MAG: dTMP kinase [Candidatus Cloacimonadaceae bacterium]|nr:dTMP kinase [Candidatus Cloacimonadaceae bacterium]